MAANNTLAVSQLDFVGITDSLINFLQNYPQFKDYDFEGSNIRTLIDLLGYNTYMNSFYTNMAINEMFLDTAVIRDSIVSHAKELNYVPRSARSSEAAIDITIYPTDNPSYIRVPAGTGFQGTSNNSVYTFSLPSDLIITGVANSYVANSVSIFEGINVTESFVVNNAIGNQRFVLSNPNIDTTSLTVNVTNSSSVSETWSFSPSMLGVSTNSQVYFIQATGNKYELIFGDDVVGQAPPNGGVISANYRISSLDGPNGITNFKSTSNLGGYSNFNINASVDSTGNTISSSGGIGPETNESIKFYAPRSFQTLDRAVTVEDYKTILFTQYPEIRAINVYGGDELSPPQYGKVFISVDVTNAVGLSQLEIDKLQSFLSTKAPIAITPVVTSADYTFIAVKSNINYNLNTTTLAPSDIQSLVLDAINGYNNSTLINFDARFRYSKLVAAIDNASTSIVDNETSISIFKKIAPVLNTTYSASLKYQNSIVAGSINSSAFTYAGVSCFLNDDGNGKLQLSSTTNGISTVLAIVGSVDYSNGIINIVNLVISEFVGNNINIFANTVSHDFSSAQNVILQIDADNVIVSVLGIRA